MYFESAERNRRPILLALKKYIDMSENGTLLEISSGTGQHVSYFASNFPNIKFQPTEIDTRLLKCINYYTINRHLSNVLTAKYLNVTTESDHWFGGILKYKKYDYVLNINMMHITEWKCTLGITSKKKTLDNNY